jgi:hypothetical protein
VAAADRVVITKSDLTGAPIVGDLQPVLRQHLTQQADTCVPFLPGGRFRPIRGSPALDQADVPTCRVAIRALNPTARILQMPRIDEAMAVRRLPDEHHRRQIVHVPVGADLHQIDLLAALQGVHPVGRLF